MVEMEGNVLFTEDGEKNRSVEVLFWNVNGIGIRTFREIEPFLDSFDVICLCETWLGGRGEDNYSLNNHILFGQLAAKRSGNKGRFSGGMLLYIRTKLAHRISRIDTPFLKNNVLWIEYKSECGRDQVMGFLYNPPRDSEYKIPDFYDLLEASIQDIQGHSNHGCSVLLMGDFNARTAVLQEVERVQEGSFQPDCLQSEAIYRNARPRLSRDKITNQSGRRLIELCRDTQLWIMNGRMSGDEDGEYTYISRAGKSVIDYALGDESCLERTQRFLVRPRIESDHMPVSVLLELGEVAGMEDTEIEEQTGEQKGSQTTSIKRFKWCFDYVGRVQARVYLLLPFLSALINVVCMSTRRTLNSCMSSMVSLLERMVWDLLLRDRHRGVQGVAREINMLDKYKVRAKRALRFYRRVRTEAALAKYIADKSKWKEKQNERLRKLSEETKSSLENAVKQGNSREMWLKIRNIMRGNVNKNSSISPQRWLTHFGKVYNISLGQAKEEWSNITYTSADQVLDRPICATEVLFALQKLRNNKAPGWDGIPMEFYKTNKFIFAIHLSKLYDFLFTRAWYPEDWAKSIIQPLFKNKGSPNNPDNWRGVALLPTVSKIFTKVLNARLNEWTKRNNIISDHQAGFREGYCTIDNIFIIRTIIDRALLKKRGKLYCCFIDFRKAFDCVNRQALWYKMHGVGVSGKMIQQLRSIYSKSKFAIKVNPNEITHYTGSVTGVLQGCQLSPLLFNIFINDLIDFLHISDCDSPKIQGHSIHALLFADDLVMISNSVKGLQRLLDRLEKWCDHWCMEVNIEKSKAIVYKKNTKLAADERWHYKNNPIEVVQEFKYLGICLSYNGKWKKHISRTITSARTMVAQLSKLSYKCPYLSTPLLLRIHDATMKAAILYGAEIWGLESCAAQINGPSTAFFKKMLRLPQSASNAGTNFYLLRPGTKIDISAEAIIKSINYWLKIAQLPDHRLVKKCFLFQLEEIQSGRMCWGMKLKTYLEALGFGEVWPHGPNDVRLFKREIETRLARISRTELAERCSKYISLTALRVVRMLVGRADPICDRTVECNPAKRRWCIMTLLSCPGGLVKRTGDSKLCSCCDKEVENIFIHIVARCSKIPQKLRERDDMKRVIEKMNSDPDSAFQTLIHGLFLSEFRFGLQRCYVKFFNYVKH